MTLVQLYHLVAITDAGLNITQAAERVHATQPGVSKQLKQLEDELGFFIFTRRGKNLEGITPAGAQVIERARAILAEAANIRALAANLRNDAAGELRIATTHTQARFVLPAAIAKLKDTFPQVSVHMLPGGDAEIHELLARGDVNVAIVSRAGESPSADRAVPLFQWDRVILVPRHHALAKRERLESLAELAHYPLVSYLSSQRPDSSLWRAFAREGLEPRIAFTAGDADLIKTYVRTGLGVGILAEMAVLPEDMTDLKVLPVDGLLPTCTTWLLLRPDRLLRDFTSAFITLLAPQIDRLDLRRALELGIAVDWPRAPHWRERGANDARTAHQIS
jgi:DNA-binding transcriptional LysR family regulator